jgi:hypothetical protein
MALLPPDFDGASPRARGDLEDATGTWAPNPQDTDFLDRAPDGCPREPMLRALDIFLRLSRDYTQISEQELAPHMVIRVTVAQEAENWMRTTS